MSCRYALRLTTVTTIITHLSLDSHPTLSHPLSHPHPLYTGRPAEALPLLLHRIG